MGKVKTARTGWSDVLLRMRRIPVRLLLRLWGSGRGLQQVRRSIETSYPTMWWHFWMDTTCCECNLKIYPHPLLRLSRSIIDGWGTRHQRVDVIHFYWGPWLTTWRSPWSLRWFYCLCWCASRRCTTCWVSWSWQLCPGWCSGSTTPLTRERDARYSSSHWRSTLWPTCTISSSLRLYLAGTWVDCSCVPWPRGWFSLLRLWFGPRGARDLLVLQHVRWTARVHQLSVSPSRQRHRPLSQDRDRVINGAGVLCAKLHDLHGRDIVERVEFVFNAWTTTVSGVWLSISNRKLIWTKIPTNSSPV